MNILLVTPPFTQLNTPYPATPYISGFLAKHDVLCEQFDLSLHTILSLFSPDGLQQIFNFPLSSQCSENSRRIYALRHRYRESITEVIEFLQTDNLSLALRISETSFLPKASRFDDDQESEWAFGTMGLRDRARYIATRYLEDLSDYIIDVIDPQFGFSRYAEQMGRSVSSFDALHEALGASESLIDIQMTTLLKAKIDSVQPDVIGITIPFPGNLYCALRCARYIRQHYAQVHIVIGGGYVSTELRSLSDPRLFDYVHAVSLDDVEDSLLPLLKYWSGVGAKSDLVATFMLHENQVVYFDAVVERCAPNAAGTPTYRSLPLDKYLSVIEVTNPMHRLWSDGRWNKLTLAHGCYWGKCTFCDCSLPYIARYAPNTPSDVVDRMQQIITETGERGFHFVDEAAPPALLKEVALEILRRKMVVSWWGNIRFEKSFTADLCRLLHLSGCIAVSGGIEVASDRLLLLINKGVTVSQVSQVAHHFTEAGIMVHGYLMYGFPTQTLQEAVDALEVVRQMFELECIQSGFWHHFALTAHSPIGLSPSDYNITITEPPFGGFARNDLQYASHQPQLPSAFGDGLRISLYNYMQGEGFDLPLQRWFGVKIPATQLPPNYIERIIAKDKRDFLPTKRILWSGALPERFESKGKTTLLVHYNDRSQHYSLPQKQIDWFVAACASITIDQQRPVTYASFVCSFETVCNTSFSSFANSLLWCDIVEEMILLV